MTIQQTVAQALEGASETHLQDIADHGIHNTTNDFQGDSDADYSAYAAEFEAQARTALNEIENAQMAAFRAA